MSKVDFGSISFAAAELNLKCKNLRRIKTENLTNRIFSSCTDLSPELLFALSHHSTENLKAFDRMGKSESRNSQGRTLKNPKLG